VKTRYLNQLNDPYEVANALALEALNPRSTALEDDLMVLDDISTDEVRATAQRLLGLDQAHLLIRGSGYPAEFEGAWAQLRKLLA
jgi:hypothetical protein